MAVAVFGLDVLEVREAVRACAHILISAPPPPYLQQFLATRLAAKNPALSAKVARLSPEESDELFRLLRTLQQAGRNV